MEETVSIQWKNYIINSPEYVEVLEETRKIVDGLRKEWLKTLIYPFIFFNKPGNMFEVLDKGIEGSTYGQWVNHIISLTYLQKNKKVVGFNFSDPNYILEEAITNETINKTLKNGHHIIRTSFYKDGWITCVYDDKNLNELKKEKTHPLLYFYYENNEVKAFKINYKEIIYIDEYHKEKDEEFEDILKKQDLQEVDREYINYTMKQGGWKVVTEKNE